MPAFDHQEQEQIEHLKHLWHDYGRYIALALLAGVIGYAGMKGWRAWQDDRAVKLAAIFAPIEAELDNAKPDAKKINLGTDRILKEAPSSTYAARAALIAARASFDAGDLKTAQTRLQWVMTNAKEAELQAVARLRLSAVLLDSQKPADALAALQGEHPAEFEPLFAEARGDALAVKGDKAGAKKAYEAAKAASDKQHQTLIDWKIESLGV